MLIQCRINLIKLNALCRLRKISHHSFLLFKITFYPLFQNTPKFFRFLVSKTISNLSIKLYAPLIIIPFLFGKWCAAYFLHCFLVMWIVLVKPEHYYLKSGFLFGYKFSTAGTLQNKFNKPKCSLSFTKDVSLISVI